ncbi:hypothetical protein OEA41_002936 [Lepraria neglecta]|uniref:Uncharacterized protein n=1 Tax=Lepraria neglecta TaxID=209136 RepID=A0AAD9Z640_9LECA|nr:hypothetical protein OEA41_002936 [Lepraria neglecta]
MVVSDMDAPLRKNKGLFLACRQTYLEATEYYWAQNTFLLSLIHPSNAPNRFAKGTQGILTYLQRTQNLYLEIGNLQLDGNDVYSLTDYGREQWNWFLQTLGQAKTGRGDKLLKTLTLIDFSVYKDYPPDVPALAKERKYAELRDGRKREALATASRPLCGRIGKIVIEIMAQLRETNEWGGL